MTTFSFEGIDAAGRKQRGRLDAPTREHAAGQLRASGLRIVSITEASGDVPFWQRDIIGGNTPATEHVLTFFRDLATLLDANLTIDRALRLTLRQSGKQMRPVVQRMLDAVVAGRSLSDAMQAERGIFPEAAIETIRAGEMTGTLAGVTTQIAETLKRQEELRSTIVSALIYPSVLLVMAVGIIIVVMSSLLPALAPLFDAPGVTPPAPIRFVNALSALRDQYGVMLAVGSVAGLLLFALLWTRPGAKAWRNRAIRRLPLVGTLLNDVDTARVCRVLGTLVGARVPLPQALAATVNLPGGEDFRQALADARRRITEGARLADALLPLQKLSPQTLDMVRTGEEVNRLGEMLLRAADLAETGVRKRIDRLFTLLVPAITCVMGIIIGGLILSIMSAVLSVNDLAAVK